MASYVHDNFKFGFSSTSNDGIGQLIDDQVYWKYDSNKKYWL